MKELNWDGIEVCAWHPDQLYDEYATELEEAFASGEGFSAENWYSRIPNLTYAIRYEDGRALLSLSYFLSDYGCCEDNTPSETQRITDCAITRANKDHRLAAAISEDEDKYFDKLESDLTDYLVESLPDCCKRVGVDDYCIDWFRTILPNSDADIINTLQQGYEWLMDALNRLEAELVRLADEYLEAEIAARGVQKYSITYETTRVRHFALYAKSFDDAREAFAAELGDWDDQPEPSYESEVVCAEGICSIRREDGVEEDYDIW